MFELFQSSTPEGIPAAFREVFLRTLNEYDEQGVFFLSPDYLAKPERVRHFYPNIYKELHGEAQAIVSCPAAAKYALFVCRAMEDRARFLQYLDLFTFPEEFPLLPFLCLIPSMEHTHRLLCARRLPEDIIQKTVLQYQDCVFLHRERWDRLGLHKRYFDHLQSYVDGRILNIDRLRFERMTLSDPLHALEHIVTGETVLLLGPARINSRGQLADTPPLVDAGGFEAVFFETENAWVGHEVDFSGRCSCEKREYSKTEYRLILSPGDPCLSVHIPNTGILSEENCRRSYERALQIFDEYYPSWQAKAFQCSSWMMAPELAELLKPGSRILSFQKPYLLYPISTEGMDVLNFVFKMKFTEYSDLPEDSFLQRELKKLYCSGGRLYEYGGILPLRR